MYAIIGNVDKEDVDEVTFIAKLQVYKRELRKQVFPGEYDYGDEE